MNLKSKISYYVILILFNDLIKSNEIDVKFYERYDTLLK